MFNVGDTVLYGKEGVCILSAVEKKKFGTEIREYYVLSSLNKENSKIFVPTDNENLVASMRRVLGEDDIKKLVAEINAGEPLWISDDNERREEYRRIVAEADCRALGKCLRGLYNRKEELKVQGKKLRRFDEDFYVQGQNILFNELSYVLKISKDKVLEYILEI